jgi:hypothetical protein
MRLQISVVYTVFLLTSLSVSRNAGSQAYSATHDFSSNTNPNGQWSYGWSQTGGAAFNLFPIQISFIPSPQTV